VETVEAFVAAFRWLGYSVCTSSRREMGFQKVALYTLHGVPKHMARQLRDGTWTSKCGGAEDIVHFTLDALESYGPHPLKAEYGRARLYMKRLFPVALVVRSLQWVEWILESSIWPRLGSILWKPRRSRSSP
jgi:hypothetical protein